MVTQVLSQALKRLPQVVAGERRKVGGPAGAGHGRGTCDNGLMKQTPFVPTSGRRCRVTSRGTEAYIAGSEGRLTRTEIRFHTEIVMEVRLDSLSADIYSSLPPLCSVSMALLRNSTDFKTALYSILDLNTLTA